MALGQPLDIGSWRYMFEEPRCYCLVAMLVVGTQPLE